MDRATLTCLSSKQRWIFADSNCPTTRSERWLTKWIVINPDQAKAASHLMSLKTYVLLYFLEFDFIYFLSLNFIFDFKQLCARLKSQDVATTFKKMVNKRENLETIGGTSEASSEGTTHSVCTARWNKPSICWLLALYIHLTNYKHNIYLFFPLWVDPNGGTAGLFRLGQ